MATGSTPLWTAFSVVLTNNSSASGEVTDFVDIIFILYICTYKKNINNIMSDLWFIQYVCRLFYYKILYFNLIDCEFVIIILSFLIVIN